MEDFERILLAHFEKYPEMTPVDAVKLCFQSAFGCGHLIRNGEFALSMLKKELSQTEENPGAQILEPIGNGYARLDLHAAKAKGIPEETICRIFIKSADSGAKTAIEPLLSILEHLAEEGRTPFPKESLSEYLSGYNGEMVSHSEIYRKAYSPAYRVVLEKLAENLQ